MNIKNNTREYIKEIKKEQEEFFATGITREYQFRRRQLKKLQTMLQEWEGALCKALWTDLHKSKEEALLTEISIVNGEIKNHLAHLKKWMKKRSVATPLKMLPSRCYITKEPLGNTLIIAPWNYPVQLLLNPVVGAISAGCTAILKPSPYVPNVSSVIEAMIASTFDRKYIATIQGNRDTNRLLLEERYDLIFFTGSPVLGQKVMEAASKQLTPVILELGGKSPCIIDEQADTQIAARRIAWGKTLNAGQTCIAPDYLLIHKNKKTDFVKSFANEIERLHGKNPVTSSHYARMVNDKAFARVSGYMTNGNIIYGGSTNANERYIAPTLLDNVASDAPVMQEEIFGPILPIVTFATLSEAVTFIRQREKPLALYYFGNTDDGFKVMKKIPSGGACINDTIMHIANENMPFGGIGHSGMGRYHGKDSFEAFSHTRSVVVTPTWLDLPFRYMPYKMFRWVKKLL